MVAPKAILVRIAILLARLIFFVSVAYASSFKLLDEISETCIESSHPEACADCLRADHSRERNEIPDFAYSILFCMYSQAIWAHDLADQLRQNAVHNPALRMCSEYLFSAANSFWNCCTMLQVPDYANAKILLGKGQIYVYKCVIAGWEQPYTDLPASLRDDLDVIKRLHAVALYMLNCITEQKGSYSIVPCDEHSWRNLQIKA